MIDNDFIVQLGILAVELQDVEDLRVEDVYEPVISEVLHSEVLVGCLELCIELFFGDSDDLAVSIKENNVVLALDPEKRGSDDVIVLGLEQVAQLDVALPQEAFFLDVE